MKGNMFHVGCIVHAKHLFDVLTFLENKRAFNVESRTVKQEKSGGRADRGSMAKGRTRVEAIVNMLKENSPLTAAEIMKQLTAMDLGASNIHGVLTRMAKQKLIKKGPKGYGPK